MGVQRRAPKKTSSAGSSTLVDAVRKLQEISRRKADTERRLGAIGEEEALARRELESRAAALGVSGTADDLVQMFSGYERDLGA